MTAVHPAAQAAFDAPRKATGLDAALDAVRRWRREQASEVSSRLDTLEAERIALVQQIEALQARIEANQAATEALLAEQADLDHAHDVHLFDALVAAFTQDAERLVRRGEKARGSEAARQAALRKAAAEDPAVRALADEVARFVEIDLDALPASYRHALVAHHTAQAERLAAFVAAHDPGPGVIDAPPLAVDLAWSVKGTAAAPAIHVLLPVPSRVRDALAAPPADTLALALAGRATLALAALGRALGLPEPSPRPCDVGTLVGLVLPLNTVPDDIDEQVAHAFAAAFDAAPELARAAVHVSAQRLGLDPIASPARPASAPDPSADEMELEVDDG